MDVAAGSANGVKGQLATYAQAEQDLAVHQSQLRSWVKAFADDPAQAFPGQGQMKPEQAEIARRSVSRGAAFTPG